MDPNQAKKIERAFQNEEIQVFLLGSGRFLSLKFELAFKIGRFGIKFNFYFFQCQGWNPSPRPSH